MNPTIDELHEILGATDDPYERMALLTRLAGMLQLEAPARARDLAREAAELAARFDEPEARAEALRIEGVCCEILSEFPSALALLDQSLTIFRKLRLGARAAAALNNIATVHYRTGDVSNALKSYTRSLELSEESGDASGTARALTNIGSIHRDVGDSERALGLFLRALAIYHDLGDERAIAIVTNNIGTVHAQLRDHEKAIEYFTAGLGMARAAGNRQGEADALANLGGIHTTLGQIPEALDSLGLTLAIYEEIGDLSSIAQTTMEIGRIHIQLGDRSEAEAHLRRALDLAERIGSRKTVAWALGRIASMHQIAGEYGEAMPVVERALEVTAEVGEKVLEFNLHRVAAEVSEKMGDTAGALDHLKRYTELREEVRGSERDRTIAEMQVRFNVERAEKELEIARLNNEKLRLQMEQKEKELTALALQLVQKNRFLDALKRQIAGGAGRSDEIAARVAREIDANIAAEGEWETFERQFEQVHPDFVRLLSERHPQLTPTELKLCALMKISLSTKEMANLLCLSVRNIENHRYRIRKKLGLGPDASLGSWLAAV
jgi:tetratricopeptide (TPR) repeat protein/DNA-binding CsgD family transcriptional regulator